MKPTEQLARFSVTVPPDLLSEFDSHLAQSGRSNRSDALRLLMRSFVTEARWQDSAGEVYGTVTLMYDHHSPCLSRELTGLQHDYGDIILCTTHAHISHESCLECILLRGPSAQIRRFVEELRKLRGLKSLDTVIASDA